MKLSDITILRRSVTAITVPNGDEVNLYPGQEVLVTQSSGSSFTLNVMGNLVYLDGKDADAINREVMPLPSDTMNIKSRDLIDIKNLWNQLKTIYDPEIDVNIVDLGLIYDISTSRLKNKNYHVGIRMTLTAPGCGMGPILIKNVENKIKAFDNIDTVDVLMVFDPPWNSDMMTEEAKLELGIF